MNLLNILFIHVRADAFVNGSMRMRWVRVRGEVSVKERHGRSAHVLLCLLLGIGLDALRVCPLCKVNKQVSEREEVADVDPYGHLSSRSANTSRNNQIGGSDGGADQELGDLHGSQVLLAWRVQADGGAGIVAVHDCVDERVENDEDPDGGSLVVDTRPHGDHGSGMVVGLEERGAATLEDDDGGVDDLVELGQIEEVAPVSESVVPEALVSVAESVMKFVGSEVVDQGREHVEEGDARVQAQDQVMDEDKCCHRGARFCLFG